MIQTDVKHNPKSKIKPYPKLMISGWNSIYYCINAQKRVLLHKDAQVISNKVEGDLIIDDGDDLHLEDFNGEITLSYE